MIYRTAKVIDNNDPDKEGKLKLRVLPEFNGVDDSLLEWSYPHQLPGGGFSGNGTHDVPEKDEFVKVVILDKFWKKIEYIPADYIIDAYPYEEFSNKVSSMSELGAQTYPQPKWIKQYKDGSFYFHNSETGESGHYNSNGSYMIFDKDGNIILNSSTNKYTMKTSTLSIKKDLFKVLLDSLKYIYTGGLVNGSGPCLPSDPSQVTAIVTALTNLENIFKD